MCCLSHWFSVSLIIFAVFLPVFELLPPLTYSMVPCCLLILDPAPKSILVLFVCNVSVNCRFRAVLLWNSSWPSRNLYLCTISMDIAPAIGFWACDSNAICLLLDGSSAQPFLYIFMISAVAQSFNGRFYFTALFPQSSRAVSLSYCRVFAVLR